MVNVADKDNVFALQAFKFAPVGHEHRFTAVPKAFVPRVPLEVLEEFARAASEEAHKSLDVVPAMLVVFAASLSALACSFGGSCW